MANDVENPFAAPTSVSTPVDEVTPELHGRMPGSVMLAIGCMAVVAAFSALVTAAVAFEEQVDPTERKALSTIYGTLCLIDVALIVGAVLRSRLARRLTRAFSLVLVSIVGLTVIVSLGGVVMMMVGIAQGVAEEDIGLPPGVTLNRFLTYGILGIAFMTAVAGLVSIPFFAYGRQSAKNYFGLFCPQCNSRRTKAANFLYTKARCKECGAVW